MYPELSGAEHNTALRIKKFIKDHAPAMDIKDLGGTGFAAVYKFGQGGQTIAFRCELDALPIKEENNFDHKSKIAGVSHKCGHDGHMAIVAGLIFWIKEQTFAKGGIVLLFQPAEETGEGAKLVVEEQRFQELGIDYIFALHNIPGAPLNQIIVLQDSFSAEVQSFSLVLRGKESLAAEPEQGINPAYALVEIVEALKMLNVGDPSNNKFAVLTPVHVGLGQKSYGISPGSGEIHYTIRTWDTQEMELLVDKIKEIVRVVCAKYFLIYSEKWFEHFPSSSNHLDCNRFVANAAHLNGFQIDKREHPFKFGEDFGWFSKSYKTSMFGLGAGTSSPALHNPDYDFPDHLIETGISMFSTVARILFEEKERGI
jgi:amidohydrolase